jgi:hypothetical protein
MLVFWVRKKDDEAWPELQYEDLVHLIPACLELSMYAKDALSSRSSSASQFAFGFRLSGSAKISIANYYSNCSAKIC